MIGWAIGFVPGTVVYGVGLATEPGEGERNEATHAAWTGILLVAPVGAMIGSIVGYELSDDARRRELRRTRRARSEPPVVPTLGVTPDRRGIVLGVAGPL